MPVSAILILPNIEAAGFANPADAVGSIPDMLDWDDPRPAREQIDANYAHGGGWHPQDGFTLDADGMKLHFPGDPPYRPLAMMALRYERIIVYISSFVAIIQLDDTFEVARID